MLGRGLELEDATSVLLRGAAFWEPLLAAIARASRSWSRSFVRDGVLDRGGGVVVVVVVVVVVAVAVAVALVDAVAVLAAEGLEVGLDFGSSSARMVSRRASTPATA